MVRIGGLSSRNYKFEARGRLWVAKCFLRSDGAHLAKLARLFAFLQVKKFPTPVPRPTLSGRLFHVASSYAVAVLPFQTGATLHQEEFSASAAADAARQIGRMHTMKPPPDLARLLAVPALPRPCEASFLRTKRALTARLDGAAPGIDATLVRRSLAQKERYLSDMPEETFGLDSSDAIVHGDFHNENVLFDAAGRVVAVLEF